MQTHDTPNAVVRELVDEPEWREAASVLCVLRPGLEANEFVLQRERLRREGYRLLGASRGEGILAVASYILLPHPVYYRELHIHDMATAHDHQSKGLGSLLLSKMDEIALANGCQRSTVNSRTARLDAHRFYRRNGYSDYSLGFIKHYSTPE